MQSIWILMSVLTTLWITPITVPNLPQVSRHRIRKTWINLERHLYLDIKKKLKKINKKKKQNEIVCSLTMTLPISALDTACTSVKKRVVELLSALCVYSQDGRQRAIDTLHIYQVRSHKSLNINVYLFFFSFQITLIYMLR